MDTAAHSLEPLGPGPLDYDHLALVDYQSRREPHSNDWVLSLSPREHVRVNAQTKKIIDTFDGNRTLDQIARELRGSSPRLDVTTSDLAEFVDKILVPNGFVPRMSPVPPESDAHSLLWWHIPLLHTDRLRSVFARTKWFFQPIVAAVAMGLLVTTVVGSLTTALSHHAGYRDFNGVGFLALTYLSLVAHELGHVSAAYRYRITAGRAGIGLYLFFPVFFVDLTNAWRLNQRERVVVDFGGVYFQALSMVPVGLLGWLRGDPGLCLAFLMLTGIAAFNLLPFLRLDGYWIVSDAANVANLGPNAATVTRRILEGKGESYPRRVVIGSILYSSSTLVGAALGVFMAARTVANWNVIWTSMTWVEGAVRQQAWERALTELNHLFLLFVPVLFLVVAMIRGVYQGARRSAIASKGGAVRPDPGMPTQP